jgi:hypothetical protein
MSRLVRLYPRAWRDRYGPELDQLLEARRPSLTDRVDLVRGAVDAWRNPQLVVRVAAPARGDRVWRAGPTLAAVTGGLLAIAGGIGTRAAPMVASLGYKDAGTPVMLLMFGMILTAIAAVLVAWSPGSDPRGRVAASVMLVAAVGVLAPWPVLIVAFFGYVAAAIAFAVIRSARDGEPLAALVALGALALLAFNTEDDRALLTIPFGLAWLLVGVGLARRRTLAPA